ncbi:hypothetical protein CEQ90_12310 [Lewinellaceae bacterium SD302]|nr:hypothetical protein CEQ90_12310 [Lewinellaceae bacterium SD302]
MGEYVKTYIYVLTYRLGYFTKPIKAFTNSAALLRTERCTFTTMKAAYGTLIRWHLVFCIFYYQVQELLEDRSLESLYRLLEPSSLLLTFLGFVIMFTYALIPYRVLLAKYGKPWYELALWLFAGSLFSAGFRYLVEEMIAPELIGFRNYPAGISLVSYYLDNLYYLVLHGAIGVIVFLLQVTRFREAQRQALAIENQRTELAFLRSQINPHFLFNTLNNVYSLFFQQSDKALKAIERLTVMLRYGLYEKADKVPLSKELEHLQNFIELEKLRYDYEPVIDFTLPDVRKQEVLVPPLLLITFVENAFKHGDLRQRVRIKLTVADHQLCYFVSNKIKNQQKDGVGGIGLVNLRKRLALLYPDGQSLQLVRRGDDFEAELKIKLQ